MMTEQEWIDNFERRFTHWNWSDSIDVLIIVVVSIVSVINVLFAPWWLALVYALWAMMTVRWSFLALRLRVGRRAFARHLVASCRRSHPRQEWPV